MLKNSKIRDKISMTVNFKGAPSPVFTWLKCKQLFLLALPLTLAVGCASGPKQSAVAHNFTDAPVASPIYERQATDQAIQAGLYALFLADRDSAYDRLASVKDGVVTLRGPLPGRAEQQRLSDSIRALPGVVQVNDERGGVALLPPPSLGP